MNVRNRIQRYVLKGFRFPTFIPQSAKAFGLPGLAATGIFLAAAVRNFALYFLDKRPEIGDSAANSFLVQLAKNFQLFHGNYSRLEFYHPGPAFLQVQAIGEIVLHDWLKLVPAAADGQLIAALALNCLLIFVLFKSVEQHLGFFTGALFFPLFVACLLLSQQGSIDGFWMPYLYILPFACYVYSLALLGTGELRKTNDKILFYFSLGLLIHGHASFMGLTVLGFLLAVALGRVGFSDKAKHIREQIGDMLRPFPILFIPAAFLLPIIIHTLVAFPGEIPSYLAYTKKAGFNGIRSSIHFALGFFPGRSIGLLVFVSLYALKLLLPWKRGGFRRLKMTITSMLSLQIFIVTLILATFYAFRGIDDLNEVNNYTVFWTAGGYAMSAGLLLVDSLISILAFLFQSADLQAADGYFGWPSLIAAISIAVTSFLFLALSPGKGYVDSMRDQVVADVDSEIVKMMTSRGIGKIRIDYLEHMQWPLIAGILLDLKRRGVPACTTWRHIAFLYTKQMVCPEGDGWDLKLVPFQQCDGRCAEVVGEMGIVYPNRAAKVDP